MIRWLWKKNKLSELSSSLNFFFFLYYLLNNFKATGFLSFFKLSQLITFYSVPTVRWKLSTKHMLNEVRTNITNALLPYKQCNKWKEAKDTMNSECMNQPSAHDPDKQTHVEHLQTSKDMHAVVLTWIRPSLTKLKISSSFLECLVIALRVW